jgi:hypothetical protein
MTREEFKLRWESNANGGGITFEDIASCAREWGIASKPKTLPISKVRYLVLREAGTTDAEDFLPQEDV